MKKNSVGIKEKRRIGTRPHNHVSKGNTKRVLFESDDVFHLIAEDSSDIIIHLQLSPTRRLAYISPSSIHITGYTPEEYYTDPEIALNSIHPDDRKLFHDFTDLDNPIGNEPVTLRWIHKDGRTIWTEQTRNVVRNEYGEAVDAFFTCRDITERKKAEEALKESQKFVSSLLGNAPHATMVINPDTSIRYVNPAWEELNGWTLSEIVNTKAPYPWWPDEFKDAFLEVFMEALKQSKGQGEVIAQKKNGELYWIDMNWAGVVHNGELQYMLINSVDITERKKLEQLQSDENRVLTLLAQGAELQDILDEIVRLGEANDASIKGSVLLLDSTEKRLLLKSAPSMPADFLEIYKDGLDVRNNVGSCGTAVFLKKRVIVPDISNSHHFLFRNVVEVAVRNGMFACWSQPIISSDGEILGTIGNYSTRIGKPSKDNLKVLEWSARIAAIAIEHKRAEDKLANEAIRRRILLEQSSDGIVILDQNGKVYETNRRFAEMIGYSVEEVMQLSVWDWEYLFPPEKVVEMVRTVDEKGDHFETKHRRKDGSVYDVEISTNGAIITGQKLIFCVCRDITERKQGEEALRESEEKYRSVVENANSGIIVIQDGMVVFNNSWVYEILGYRTEDNTPFDFISKIYPEDVPLIRKRIKERLAGVPATDSIVVRVTTKSGEVKWIETRSVKIQWNNRPAVQAFILDVSERKRAEEALKESEEKFSAAFHSSPDLIAIINLNEHKYIEVNDSFCTFSGYTREELIGSSKRELNIWADSNEEARLEQLLGEDGKIRHEEYHFRTKSGEIRTWLCSADIINIGGEPCMLSVATDITERKIMENELRSNEERFRLIADNSADLITRISLTPEVRTDYVSPSCLRITGYNQEEFYNDPNLGLNMIHPEDRHNFLELTTSGIVKQEKPFTLRIVRKDGRVIWIEQTHIVIKDEQGKDQAVHLLAHEVTERVKAEEALRESEEKFSKAFHASPGSISISRLKDGKFIEVNDSFLRDKGFTREEVIGKSVVELGLADINSKRPALHNQVKEHGRVNNRLFEYRNKAGELRYSYSSSDIIKLGNEPCIITQSTDVTEQKRAEDKLRLLGSITQQVSDATIVVDLDFKITYINQAAQDLLGYSMDEVQGREMGIFSEKPVPVASKQKILKVLSSGEVWSGTVTKKKKDGSLIICESKLSPLLDENGKTQSYIDTLRDVTKQKETEAKLKIQRQLNERILATMPEGVIVVDDDNRILLANKAFRHIFQINRKSTQYKALSEIIHKEQLLKNYHAVKQGEKASCTLEFRNKLDDIEKVIACNIIEMDGGQTLLTFTDISKEREEEEKLYLTDRLASIGEMAAGLAHELNNPLTGVLALSQLLIDSDIREEYKEDLRCVFEEARRAADIVKNVLLFARNNNYENGQASVNEVLNSVLRLREYEEKVSNITVVKELQEDLPDVTIDKFQLQQVFLNIILNAEAAIRDTRKPGKLIVQTERVNNHIHISFKDNGCGIKKTVISRIFDPFFTTKEIGKGTGLGLSICYGIVVKNGGRINVQSQVNEGTTFTVRMPVASSKRTGKKE